MNKTLQVLLVASGIFVFALSSCNYPSKTSQAAQTVTQSVNETPAPFLFATPTTQSFATLQQIGTPPTDIAIVIPGISFTSTPTLIPSTVTITVEDSAKGDYLTIHRSTDNLEYKIGPIAKGVYAIGPNDVFWVYCTLGGSVYAAKIGDPRLTTIGSVKYFAAIKRNVLPDFRIVIHANNNLYKAEIMESKYVQNETFNIPSEIAH
jgi:hypothetical protein